MTVSSEMYQVFESPYPTLLTHTDNGLGIFVSHPPLSLSNSRTTAAEGVFEWLCSELNFSFPLRGNAQKLLNERGGLVAFMDATGMPWYTMDIESTSTLNHSSASMLASSKGKDLDQHNDEGEFSL